VIEEYLPLKMEAFETVKGFYDCSYFMDKYYPRFLEAPDDCEVIREVYSRLKFAGCSDAEPKFAELIQKGNEKCAPEKGPAEVAYLCLRDADYSCAIDGFLKASREVEDAKKKAELILLAAKVYYVHLKNFSRARQLALEAATIRPNWGEPYLIIGRMYASSGPLCGPGRGWESQVVVWVAIDAWMKAKNTDPAFAAEANKMINQYARFMPNKEDVFIRGLKSGEKFFVGCWIQESTLIRTVD
jgi:tetratricopeptide (TPR) repeat protein